MSMRQCGSTGLGDRKKSNSLPQALPWWEGLHACTGMVHLAPGCLLHPSQGWPSCCWMAPSCILLQQIGFCFFPCSLPEDAELSRCCWGSQTSPAVATSSEGGEACPWTAPCACSPKACSVSAGSHYCGCLEERGRSLGFLLAAFVLAESTRCKQRMEKEKTSSEELQLRVHAQLSVDFIMAVLQRASLGANRNLNSHFWGLLCFCSMLWGCCFPFGDHKWKLQQAA